MFKKVWESIFGQKIGETRVFPVSLKIAITFTLFILVSNISTNYINLMFNQAEQIKLTKQLLVKDLKGIYNNANNQFQIYQYTMEKAGSISNIEKKAAYEFKHKKSLAMGVLTNGSFLFQATSVKKQLAFTDLKTLKKLNAKRQKGIEEGVIRLKYNHDQYFAVYKYNKNWKAYFIRGEELNEFYSESRRIFWNVTFIILIMTAVMALVGMMMLEYILRFVNLITRQIMRMSEHQQLELIKMNGAANDDVTFLGMAFNSLSGKINNLLSIFRKFVNKDTALKAYRERRIRLEGSKKELTMLFSDIKGFTFMTETLGNDIIRLLNLHYDKAIREILEREGIIGSIIGDALLAVFGALEGPRHQNKSMLAVKSAYAIHAETENLRQKMKAIKENVEAKKGRLSEAEIRVYQAVLLEVGVGIDGGQVFYGNIGSYERMTNTVIGDNVNSASRLEGLTRIYKVPVIVSEYVKNDIESNVKKHDLHFVEIDQVQVKGKTIAKKIYWPIREEDWSDELSAGFEQFGKGLELYYQGKWKEAKKFFEYCNIEMAKVFLDRVINYTCPKDWKGVWTMKTK